MERIRDRVDMWIFKELPLRPGNVKTSLPKEERQRPKSPTRRRSQEQENEMYSKGLSAWDVGKIEEVKRHKLMKTLRSARRELTDKLQLTEELRLALAALIEEAPESETKEEAIDFLLNLKNIERINQLKWLMSEAHQAEVEKQFQLGVIRGEDYKSDKWGTDTTQETKDTPGATSSKDHVRINMIRIKMIKVREDEDSEDFELVETDEEQKKEQEKKEIQAEVTLIELMHMLKDAEENEDILDGQEQRIAFMLEELDKPRLEEFLQRLEEFKERVEIKKQKQNCLDILRDIKEMIENQKAGHEHRERAEKKNKEPPPPQEGRKLYATKYGEKYHFDKHCKGFNGHQNFEWKSCVICNGQTERILDLSNSGSSSSTEARATDDILVFT